MPHETPHSRLIPGNHLHLPPQPPSFTHSFAHSLSLPAPHRHNLPPAITSNLQVQHLHVSLHPLRATELWVREPQLSCVPVSVPVSVPSLSLPLGMQRLRLPPHYRPTWNAGPTTCWGTKRTLPSVPFWRRVHMSVLMMLTASADACLHYL